MRLDVVGMQYINWVMVNGVVKNIIIHVLKYEEGIAKQPKGEIVFLLLQMISKNLVHIATRRLLLAASRDMKRTVI